ncbi:PREDICTED: uncharacterized protein LOC108362147, partial [Rhagoletis zephyria]|uniref:uncharacterized protein LOC108362147 n=1 Tax=Rhagoletis zephyria TaxID=28612 RepID=UPI0008119A3D
AQATISIDSTNHSIHEILFAPENCVWKRSEPTFAEYVIYAFVVPVLSCFGLCANFINAIVFMRPKMTPSAFTYLAALGWLDCFSCILILLTALSRSVFYNSIFWMRYDFQWQTPLFSISTGAANLLLASVSCDRWIYLRHGIANGGGPPWFCRRKVARRVIGLVIVISVIINIPYFFVFVVNDDGTFKAHKLYYTTFYKISNWSSLTLLTLLPAIFLVVGNIAIVIAFRRWTQQSRKFQRNGNANSKTTQKRYHHQMKLTITIIIIITLYMVGELPAAMTSRKSALNLLFGGDVSRVNFSLICRLELICLTLNALQLSMNILVYAIINPSFIPEFFDCLRGASDACCSILCLMPLIKCVRRNCCSTKNDKQLDTNRGIECGLEHKTVDIRKECESESQRVEVRKSVRGGNEGRSASETGNWDTEPEEAAGVFGFNLYRNWQNSVTTRRKPNPYRHSGRHSTHEHEVWSTEMAWKRSTSFSEYVFDNQVLQIDTVIEEVTRARLEEIEKQEKKQCNEIIISLPV